MSVNVDGVVFGIRRPRPGDAGGRPDRCDCVPRRAHRDAERPCLRGHEARRRRLRPQRRPDARCDVGSRSTRSARVSPIRRWWRTTRASSSRRRIPLLQPADVADAVWLALTLARRATPGASSPVRRRSTSASRTSPARAGRRHRGRAAATDTLRGVESDTPHGENFVVIQHKRTCAWDVRLRRGGSGLW